MIREGGLPARVRALLAWMGAGWRALFAAPETWLSRVCLGCGGTAFQERRYVAAKSESFLLMRKTVRVCTKCGREK